MSHEGRKAPPYARAPPAICGETRAEQAVGSHENRAGSRVTRRWGRYVDAELPTLPFADASFDLALCSHFLFLYSEQLGEAFHRAAIQDLCRVATEVRIFPLLALGGRRSPYVDANAGALRAAGFEVSIERVPYEFVRGADHMLRIRVRR